MKKKEAERKSEIYKEQYTSVVESPMATNIRMKKKKTMQSIENFCWAMEFLKANCVCGFFFKFIFVYTTNANRHSGYVHLWVFFPQLFQYCQSHSSIPCSIRALSIRLAIDCVYVQKKFIKLPHKGVDHHDFIATNEFAPFVCMM